MLLGIGTSLCTTMLFVYTSELYPTRMRGLGVAGLVGTVVLAGFGLETKQQSLETLSP